MPVAAIYDIHGNLPALEAVIHEIMQAGGDQIVVGGDVVAGPMPRETLDYLRNLSLPVHFIRGNADREIVAQMAGQEVGAVPDHVLEIVRWVAGQLSPADADMMANWPQTLRVQIAGIGEVLFCHATPRNDTDVFTRDTPTERLLSTFEDVAADLVVCGHTHMQFERMIGRVHVVNAGSVGMPYAEAGAYWLLLGPDIAFKRTAYDTALAAERVRSTQYPQAQDFADNNIVRPHSESEALAFFQTLAI